MLRKFGSRSLVFVLLVGLLAGLGLALPTQAAIPAAEAGLNPAGASYEINPDAAGKLWVTDNTAGEIWGIDLLTGAYDAYLVGSNPADARHVGDYIWWADFWTNTIGRVSLSGDYTLWQVPDAYGFYSTYMDGQGRFYAAELDDKYLYRLDPAASTDNLCTFTLPPSASDTDWISSYMTGAGNDLWVADWWGQLLRMDTSDYSATVWTLTTSLVEREPIGVALDAQGNLWYADEIENVLGQLNPLTNQVTIYPVPEIAASSATMLAVQSGYIWYSDEYLPGFGRLDPSTASFTTFSPPYDDTLDLTPTCTTLSVLDTGTLTVNHGTLSWQDASYPTLVNADGWMIYTTPEDSSPWGITVPDSGFLVDYGRNMLINFPTESFNIFLPVIIK